MSFEKSEKLLIKAEKVIPNGTQTFSKSKTQFPIGSSPFYATKGKGCYLWDADDNKYIDLSMGLCSTMIGYADPDVNRAVRQQMKKGSILSLATELEIDVANEIKKLVPCAEMVRFGKNGSDVTTGAVRLARAFTRKKYIIKCRGHYHGWHSWTIYHVNSMGVDPSEYEATLLAEYNNLESFSKLFATHKNDIAAVIIEPMNIQTPNLDFFPDLKKICAKNGALLIFDEVITGFRFGIGGAQEYFKIKPDLCCLGKGLANGFPLSALAGRADVMKLLEKVHFSFTFGGDCIGLAAAKATLDKLQKYHIPAYINEIGGQLKNAIQRVLSYHHIHFIKIEGHPAWTHLIFEETEKYSVYEIKSLFLQEAFKRGILTSGTHNLCYALKQKHLDFIIEMYYDIFQVLKNAVYYHRVLETLECEPIKPLFKVR